MIGAGFSDGLLIRRENTWIPFTVVLANDGDSLSGELVISINETDIKYHTPVDLPGGSRKVVRLAVYPMTSTDEFKIDFVHGSGLLRTELSPRLAVLALDPQIELVAIIASSEGQHRRLGIFDPESESAIRRVIYAEPITLPEHWLAYAGIDALVWDGGSVEELTEAQQDALSTWIQMGGHLVLSLGESWNDLNGSSWSRFLPVNFDGSEVIPAGTKVKWPGAQEDVTLDRDTVVATTSSPLPVDAVVALRTERIDASPRGKSLLIRQKSGAGVIDTLLFSIAGNQPRLLPDEYDRNLLDILVGSNARLPQLAANQVEPSAASFLRTEVQGELPSAWFIAGFLGLYILLVVPVNYFIFRRLGRLEWAWFMVPVWAVIFAVAAYYIGSIHQRGQVTVAEFSIVEAAPSSSFGRALSLVSLYSPVREMYEIKLEDQIGFFSLHSASENPNMRMTSGAATVDVAPLSVRYEDGMSVLERILVYHWSQKTVKVTSKVNLGGGIDVDLDLSGPTIGGKVRNGSKFTLYDAEVVIGTGVYEVGTLQPGQEQTPRFIRRFSPTTNDPMAMMRFQSSRSRRVVSGDWQTWREHPERWIRDQALPIYQTAFMEDDYGKGMAFLTAYIEAQLVQPEVGRGIGEHFGHALVCVPFMLKPAHRAEERIKPELWRKSHNNQLANMSGISDTENLFVNPGSNNFAGGAEIEAHCQLQLASVRIDKLKIRLGIGQNHTRKMDQRGGRQMSFEDYQAADPGNLRQIKIEMRQWATHVWTEVPFETGELNEDHTRNLRDIVITPSNPSLFLDCRDSRLRFRISNPTDCSLMIPLEEVDIEAEISSVPTLPLTREDARLLGEID